MGTDVTLHETVFEAPIKQRKGLVNYKTLWTAGDLNPDL